MPLLSLAPSPRARSTRRALLVPAVTAVAIAAGLPALPARADATTYLSGPDVSHWQHVSPCPGPNGGQSAPCPVDFAAVHGAGQSFVISKATEGTTFTDPYFATDYAAVQANGMVRGAYHFARPQLPISTAIAQADYYAGTIGTVQEAGDLPPIMDFEVSGGLAPRDLITWTQTFLGEVMAKTGRTPMIYTYRDFWRTAMLNTTAFTRYPLWIADWTAGATVPTAPLIGGWPTWTMWQWTSSLHLAGITPIVDDSHFNGTSDQLAAFADGTHPSVLAAVPPTAPIAVQAGPAGNALSVSWLPQDNGGLPLTSYTVTINPGNVTQTVPGTQTSTVIPGLSSSVLYTATVSATSPAGSSPQSQPSSPVAATTGVVPVTLSVAPIAGTVNSGHPVSLVGKLNRSDGLGGVGGAPIVVYGKLTGAAGYVPMTSVITSSTGSFSVPVVPGVSTRYSLQYVGGGGWAPATAGLLVSTKATVTTALSKYAIPRTHKVTLRGQVSVAAAGRTVFRQRWYANAWHSGPGAVVSKTGRYQFTVQPTVRGKTKLRVILSSKPGLVGAYSPTVVLKVY